MCLGAPSACLPRFIQLVDARFANTPPPLYFIRISERHHTPLLLPNIPHIILLRMCKPGTCTTCHVLLPIPLYLIALAEESSWWGCGSHVPMFMDKIDKDSWCTCTPKVEKNGTAYPPMAAKADWLPGWLCNMLVRRS